MCVSDKIPSEKKRIIAATAHYEKFAPAVLKVFHDDISTKTLSELSEMLKETDPTHSSHPNLEKVINANRVQTESISANYEELLHKVEDFIKNQ